MMGLTRRQTECLGVLREFIAAHGFPPSMDEIATKMGTRSRGRVAELLKALEKRGFIRRLRNRARAIELVEHDQDLIRLSPDVSRAIAGYAQRTRAPSKQAAANELLREYLGKVAA